MKSQFLLLVHRKTFFASAVTLEVAVVVIAEEDGDGDDDCVVRLDGHVSVVNA